MLASFIRLVDPVCVLELSQNCVFKVSGMKSRRPVKNLKEIIFDSSVKLDSNRGLTCAYDTLRASCPACKGYGIVSDIQGAFIQSKVCSDCVGACVVCFGKCAHEVSEEHDGVLTKSVKQCVTPSLGRVVSILNNAHLPARYAKATLKEFANRSGNYQKIISHIEKWIQDFKFERSQSGLVLQGDVGIGKTYLLICIAKRLAIKGIGIKFVDFFQLLLDIKTKFEGKTTSLGANSYIKELIDAPVLIIDELGKGRLSDFETMVLDQIVMGRYNSGKPIIASTNYRLGRYDQASRYQRDRKAGGFTAVGKHTVNLDETPPERMHLNSAFQNTNDYLEARVGARIYSRIVESAMCLEWENAKNIRYQHMKDSQNIFAD